MIHEFKVEPEIFDSIFQGERPWDIRLDADMVLQGDLVRYMEYVRGEGITGRWFDVRVDHVERLTYLDLDDFVGMTLIPVIYS